MEFLWEVISNHDVGDATGGFSGSDREGRVVVCCVCCVAGFLQSPSYFLSVNIKGGGRLCGRIICVLV